MIKKILFYYHHFGGLGHGMRIYSICKAIKNIRPTCKLLVINSGIPQPELNLERYAKVINLPFFKAKEGLFSGLYSPQGRDVTFRKRGKILNVIVEKFKPHIAIFEHYPFGRCSLEEEILKFINDLRQRKTWIYSSARDIIMQKILPHTLRKRLELFDVIFVHSDKEMGFKTDFKKSKLLNDKIILTGRTYPIGKEEIIDKKKIRNTLKYLRRKLILINVGGGIDGAEIIKKLIRIKNRIDKKVKVLYLISTGPSIKESIFRKLETIAKERNNIIIKKFIPEYPNYVNAADLYISMGGYNSINNALFTNTKTIIFPRDYDNEQKLRAKYFKRFLNIGNIHSSPNVLISDIINVMHRKRPKMKYNGKFKGADTTARLLNQILNLNYIKIRLTTKCTCNCDMCSVKHQRDELEYSKVKQVIEHAKLLDVKTINFTGGEPTLYPNFYNLMNYTKKLGFSVSVSTSGVIERGDLRYLLRYSDFVDISINSYKYDIEDRIKGRCGTFKKSLDSINYLRRLNENIKLHINVTVRPDNFENIHKIVPLMSKCTDTISFTLVDTSINKLEYLKFKKEQLLSFYFKEIPLILKECIRNNIRVRITPFFKDLQNLNNRVRLKRLLTNKKYYLSKFKSIFEITSIGLCERAKNDLRVNANGWICPCCYLDDYPINLGNIYNNSLLEIVSSDEYFNFITSARPDRGWCKKCTIGYKIYSKFFE